MKRILTFTALFLFAAMANAQAKNNASVKYAPTAPSGVAPVNVLPIQVYQGNIYVYNSSTSDWYCSTCGGGTTTNALTAAATGGAAPGTTFNGSAAVTFDYHSFGAQVNLSLIKGTLTDGDMCTYTAAGTLLNCNTAVPSGSGTVNSGTAGQIAHYGATGTAVSGTNALDNGTTATTQTPGNNSTNVATTAYVDTGLSGKASSTASATVNGQTCTLGSSCTVTAAPNAAINLAASGAGGVTGVLPSANIGPPTMTVSSGSVAAVTTNNTYIICTTTCNVTPLQAAAGVQLCVRNAPGSATVITLNALGASNYYELTTHAGWGTANHTVVSGGMATDQICLVGYDATHYAVFSYTGTWTD
jgi:hypothetical protein